jgi:hypothetical protein
MSGRAPSSPRPAEPFTAGGRSFTAKGSHTTPDQSTPLRRRMFIPQTPASAGVKLNQMYIAFAFAVAPVTFGSAIVCVWPASTSSATGGSPLPSDGSSSRWQSSPARAAKLSEAKPRARYRVSRATLHACRVPEYLLAHDDGSRDSSVKPPRTVREQLSTRCSNQSTHILRPCRPAHGLGGIWEARTSQSLAELN